MSNTCVDDPDCGDTENSCVPGTLTDTSDTPKTDAVCAVTEAARCTAGTFVDKTDTRLDDGACGSVTNECSGGTRSNSRQTTRKNLWDCIGVDEAKLWQCDGIDGAKNWTCTSGTELEQCSVPDSGRDRGCKETITDATDDRDCYSCKPCTGNKEVLDTGSCDCDCEQGYHRHNGPVRSGP